MHTQDLTSGNTFYTLTKLSIPLLLGNILFASYSIISIVWIGHLIGKDALGAVAIGTEFISFIIALGNGASTGITALISNYYGAQKYNDVKRITIHSILLTVVIIVITNLLCILNLDTILAWLNTPNEILSLTKSYIKISMISTIFMYLYLVFSAVLRGIGNVILPMIFIGIATIINIILDPLLILGIGPLPKLGLNGTAYASIFSQGSIFLIVCIYLIKNFKIFNLKKRHFKISLTTIIEIFKISFPSMLQRSIMSIGSMMVISYVNALDVCAISAFSVASNIDILITTPSNSISVAVSSITGQCIGANKKNKIKEIFKYGNFLSIPVVITITILSLTCPKFMLSIFTNDINVQHTGTIYLHIVSLGYVAFSMTAIASGILIGMKDTIKPMLFTLIGLWVVRVPLASVLSKGPLGFKGICISILLSTIVVMFLNIIYYFYKMSKFIPISDNKKS